MLWLIRESAFLSLRGFKTIGIESVKVVSPVSETHRDRRLRAISEASSHQQSAQVLNDQPPQRSVQQPKLKTVSSARLGLAGPSSRGLQPREKKIRRKHRQLRTDFTLGRSWFEYSSTCLPVSDVNSLRHDLGLLDENREPEDAVYVAIDTEGSKTVSEIGISTLDTRDIKGTAPDHRAANWIAKVKHQHFVFRKNQSASPIACTTALFCDSQLDIAPNIRAVVVSTLRFARQPSAEHAPRKVHLVGQSIAGDINVLRRSQNMRIDLSKGPSADFSFDKIYDTSQMSIAAKQDGAIFPCGRLGHLARRLEVDPAYWHGDTVRGIHNASNDAAYTMMVMLLFAVRWPRLPEELKTPPPPLQLPTGSHGQRRRSRLKSSHYGCSRRTPRFSGEELVNRRLRDQRLAQDALRVPRPGLLGKLESAVRGLIWGWK